MSSPVSKSPSPVHRAKSFLTTHEKRLSLFAFAFGFVWDTLTLTRIDRLFDNIVLTSYLFTAFFSIALINAHSSGNFKSNLIKKGSDFARFLLPFAFGGLFSGFLIFYSRSGEVFTSAPFLLLLVALFLGNEFFKKHYQRLMFQMSIFFVTLFSYAVLIIPILVGEIGGFIFLLSGVASIFLFLLALRGISLVAREEVEKTRYSLYAIIAIIFLTFNFLYFNNMIPPIPLSLKEIGVYHEVSRTRSGGYHLVFEKAPWYSLGKKTSSVFNRTGSEPIYVWSSVFAPTRLETEVQHHWSYFDEKTRVWVSSSVVGFPISGGRDDGYRGYSMKENASAGKWRVDVETLRGQVIGRFEFTVDEAKIPPELSTELK